jgi:hypothetical protein
MGMVRDPDGHAMSWSELERLVEDAEADTTVRRALRHCRSQQELVLAARRLGYRITRVDLLRAWQIHCREQPLQQGRG